MAYVQWPPLPAFKSAIASNDVYLNVANPLTVIGSGGGGGTAPGNVPAPVAGTITSTSIEITFDVAAVTGTQPITYNALVSNTSGGPYNDFPLNVPVGTVYTGTASGLTPNTPYYFIVRATNASGQTDSTESEITTTAVGPTPPGNIPNTELIDATNSVINVYIDTAGVTGDVPITYTAVYGTAPESWTYSLFFSLSTGTIYTGTTTISPPSTTYYFQTQALNAAGTVSTIAPYPAFSTLGLPTAPGAPQPSLANNGSLMSTLYFDTANVMGAQPITYDMIWSINALPFISTTATLSTGTTIYSAVINDLPTNNGAYNVYARATNALGTSLSDNTAINGSTIASVVTVTPSTMSIGLAGIGPTVISLSTGVVVSGNPVAELVAIFGTVSSSLISTTGTFDQNGYVPDAVSTIQNLPSSTTFYFNSLAYNTFGSTINTTMIAISTPSS